MRMMLVAALCVVAGSAGAQIPLPGQWTAPTDELMPAIDTRRLTDADLETAAKRCDSHGGWGRPFDGAADPVMTPLCDKIQAERYRRDAAFVARAAREIGR